MDAIAMSCPECKHSLRFPAASVGRKAKCPKCGAMFTIAAAPPPAPAKPAGDGYGLVEEPVEEKPKKKEPEKKPKKEKSTVKIRKKKLVDPAEWDKVKTGLMLLFGSACLWGFIWVVEIIVVLIGVAKGPEYSTLVTNVLMVEGAPLPEPGQWETLDMPRFAIAVVVGQDNLDTAKVLRIVTGFLTLIQIGVAMAGMVLCLCVPSRFGERGYLFTGLGFAAFNFLMYFLFKILPDLGAMSYALLPFFSPEMPTVTANMERTLPVHLFWMGAPFWETFLTLFLLACRFLEPAMVCATLCAIGKNLREVKIEENGEGTLQMCLGTFFCLFTYHLMSITGASEVAVTVLRVIYMLYAGFLLYFQVRYALSLYGAAAIIGKRVASSTGADEEGDDEDEEEMEERPKKRRRLDDDEDEDDGDDEDEEEEDEDE